MGVKPEPHPFWEFMNVISWQSQSIKVNIITGRSTAMISLIPRLSGGCTYDRNEEESPVSAGYACASFPQILEKLYSFVHPRFQNVMTYDIIINYAKSAVSYSAVSSRDDNFS